MLEIVGILPLIGKFFSWEPHLYNGLENDMDPASGIYIAISESPKIQSVHYTSVSLRPLMDFSKERESYLQVKNPLYF